MITGVKSAFKDMRMQVKELEVNGQPVTGDAPAPPNASAVPFTSSEGLAATNVAAALDELKALIDGLA